MSARILPICILCRQREAKVPDRDKPGSRKKEICRQCHGNRLMGDFQAILNAQRKKHPQ